MKHNVLYQEITVAFYKNKVEKFIQSYHRVKGKCKFRKAQFDLEEFTIL